MTSFIDAFLVLMILTSFSLLGSSRLTTCIRMMAIQGFTIGLLPLASGHHLSIRVAAISLAIIILKAFVFPHVLTKSLRVSNTSYEVEPYVGYIASLFIGVLILVGSFWLDMRLHIPIAATSKLVAPVSFSMILTGLFVMVARRTALNQVLGYVLLENGIYTFGLAIVSEIPMLIELGVLLDMFVAIFIMGIMIDRISREFDHIDADKLDSLKG